MPANAAEIMHVLAYGRVVVRLVDGRLQARHLDGPTPKGAVEFIERFRDVIIAALREQEATQ